MICRDDVISNAMQRIICTFCRRPFFQGWDRGTTDYTPNSLRGPTYIPLHRLARQIVFPSKDLVRFFWVHHFCSEFWWVGKALPCETHGFHIDFSQCHRKSSLKQWKGYEWRSFNPSRFMLHVDSYLLCLWGFSSWLHPEVISRC